MDGCTVRAEEQDGVAVYANSMQFRGLLVCLSSCDHKSIAV